MISSHEVIALSPALQKLLNALDLLHHLQNQTHKASNGKLIITTLKQLQEAYHALDSGIATVIDNHLKTRNPELLDALKKKGSKICKPLELANKLHDSLSEELKVIIAANPDLLISPKTIDISAVEQEDETVLPDAGTMIINSGKESNNQLSPALKRAGSQMDSNLYFLFSNDDADEDLPIDPLLAVIHALEILLKTQINKDKINRDEAKPLRYDNTYRTTLLKQFNVLKSQKHIFTQCLANSTNPTVLTAIIELLNSEKCHTVPDMLIISGKISQLIDDRLMMELRKQSVMARQPKI